MWALILLFGIVLAQLAVASDSLEWSEFLPNAITRERPTLLSYFSDNLQIPAQIRLYRADKFFSFPETLTESALHGGFIWLPSKDLPIGEFYQLEIRQGARKHLSKRFYLQERQGGDTTSVAVVTQISDGAIQAPTSAPAPVTQISDGEIQAPTSAAPVTQISDGEIQAPTSAPAVTQISDGEIQAPTSAAAPTAQQTPSDNTKESPTSSTQTSSATADPRPAHTPTSASDQKASHKGSGLSTGAAIGIGIAIAVVALVLLAVAGLFCYKKHIRKKHDGVRELPFEQANTREKRVGAGSARELETNANRHELNDPSHLHELGTKANRHEMGAKGRSQRYELKGD